MHTTGVLLVIYVTTSADFYISFFFIFSTTILWSISFRFLKGAFLHVSIEYMRYEPKHACAQQK